VSEDNLLVNPPSLGLVYENWDVFSALPAGARQIGSVVLSFLI
jgi:hypothetical protein